MFLSFYVLVSLGLTINLHYCGDRLESLKLFENTESCCCGGETTNKSCCENQFLHYAISDEQRVSQDFRILTIPSINLDIQPIIDIALLNNEHNLDFQRFENNSSPPYKNPFWILNCSLIYYA
ncbi:MAG: hypothetical protein A2W99_12060 [Bacteroidetes bacterium GWF2_33_16]|nr:MAG: hypothetical protein A2X00_02215 [Bacteroidetes bacterium GWE2_32_14]OFY06432.1 MAG: hypothetical protein A2W99_12060 [Bacteroidetes bacterium GWF2_33_16]